MARVKSVGAPKHVSKKTVKRLVGGTSVVTASTNGSHGDNVLPKSSKRKAKDPPTPDPPTMKRQKIAGRSQRNPYQYYSGILPRFKKPVLAKMPKMPSMIHCEKCGHEKPKLEFDCEAPCKKPHVPTFCYDCTQSHVANALASEDVDAFKCPTCSSYWFETYLRRFFSAEERLQYHHLSKSHPHYRPCLSPNCAHGQIHDTSLPWLPKVTCNDCGAVSCYSHKIPWHTGLSCGEYYDKVMAEREEASARALSDKSSEPSKSDKCCPDCKLQLCAVDDTDAVLQCTTCKIKWCSQCLVNQAKVDQDGAHRHGKKCKYWAHPPWDTDGDVKVGLARLRKSKQGGASMLSVMPHTFPMPPTFDMSAMTLQPNLMHAGYGYGASSDYGPLVAATLPDFMLHPQPATGNGPHGNAPAGPSFTAGPSFPNNTAHGDAADDDKENEL